MSGGATSLAGACKQLCGGRRGGGDRREARSLLLISMCGYEERDPSAVGGDFRYLRPLAGRKPGLYMLLFKKQLGADLTSGIVADICCSPPSQTPKLFGAGLLVERFCEL